MQKAGKNAEVGRIDISFGFHGKISVSVYVLRFQRTLQRGGSLFLFSHVVSLITVMVWWIKVPTGGPEWNPGVVADTGVFLLQTSLG